MLQAAFSIRATDEFVIVASDGLWETFTHEQAVRWVHQYTEDHQVPPLYSDDKVANRNVRDFAHAAVSRRPPISL